MARIVYRHLSTFYTWALTRLEHLPANPCRDAWRPKRSEPRDRVLSDREVAALWQAAVEDGYPFGHLVQMLILTAQRRGEVLDATSDEFDFKGKVWTVPGDRAKNGKANVVPYPHSPSRSSRTSSRPPGSRLKTLTSNPKFYWHQRSPAQTVSVVCQRPGSG